MTKEVIYGFKGFERIEGSRLKCKTQWYTIGKTTRHSGVKDAQIPSADIVMCRRGFHFCRELIDVNAYYIINESVIARVSIPIGAHLIEKNDKCVTNCLCVEELLSGTFETCGISYTFKNGRLVHKIGTDGEQIWQKNGKLHRDGDLPAIIYADGTQEWWRDGKLHRDGDLPAAAQAAAFATQAAVILCDGTQEWWKDGKRQEPPPLSVSQLVLALSLLFLLLFLWHRSAQCTESAY